MKQDESVQLCCVMATFPRCYGTSGYAASGNAAAWHEALMCLSVLELLVARDAAIRNEAAFRQAENLSIDLT